MSLPLAGNRLIARDALRGLALWEAHLAKENPGTHGDRRAMAKDMAEHSGLAFLRTELRVGLTMARIALQARHAGKKERNRVNARKAYDAILHYLPGSNLSSQQAQEIKTGLSELRSELETLGEEF